MKIKIIKLTIIISLLLHIYYFSNGEFARFGAKLRKKTQDSKKQEQIMQQQKKDRAEQDKRDDDNQGVMKLADASNKDGKLSA
jgi:hypothetical protein